MSRSAWVLVSLILVLGSQSSIAKQGKDDKYVKVVDEMKTAKLRAEGLVGEMKSYANQIELVTFREKYDQARTNFGLWSGETSRALRGMQKIDPVNSEYAQNARASINDLVAYSNVCVKNHTPSEKGTQVSGNFLPPWVAKALKQAIAEVAKNPKIISDVGNTIKTLKQDSEKEELAKEVETYGNWATFDEIGAKSANESSSEKADTKTH